MAGEPTSGVSTVVVLGLLSVHRPLGGGAAVTDSRQETVPGRRAVTIGIEKFDDPYERLPFAHGLTTELSEYAGLAHTTTPAEKEEIIAAITAAIEHSR